MSIVQEQKYSFSKNWESTEIYRILIAIPFLQNNTLSLGLRKPQYLETGEFRETLNSAPKFQTVRNVPESQVINAPSHIN